MTAAAATAAATMTSTSGEPDDSIVAELEDNEQEQQRKQQHSINNKKEVTKSDSTAIFNMLPVFLYGLDSNNNINSKQESVRVPCAARLQQVMDIIFSYSQRFQTLY
jgi:hypothetical protein